MLFLGGSQLPDPLALYDYKIHVGYNNVSGRTSVSPALTAGEKTLIAFVVGQSLGANYGVNLYSPTNAAKVQNFNIADGILYRCVDPVLGASGVDGSYIGRLGDKLIAAGKYARCIFIPISIGATAVGEWGRAGDYNHRLIAALLRARALKWLQPSADATLAVLWDQGQADGQSNITQAAYEAGIKDVQATFTERGVDIPWLLAKSTMVTNITDPEVRAAIGAVVGSGNRVAGPGLDSLTGTTYRQADGTHLKDAGNDAAATLWATAIQAAL